MLEGQNMPEIHVIGIVNGGGWRCGAPLDPQVGKWRE